ncbi:MAG: UTP--glucose-1-phosphate uridylyltransferase [Thermoguttaceae bacterium]
MPNTTISVIPVAGRGTSLLPLTKSQPKEMLPVGSRPVVQHVVEELNRSGVTTHLFVTGANKTAIEDHFDINIDLINYLRKRGREEELAELEFERENATYFFTRQRIPLGLGHAVLCAESFVRGESFVVALGDTLLGTPQKHATIVSEMIETFHNSPSPLGAVIAFDTVEPQEVSQYGIATPGTWINDRVFELADIVEKPSPSSAPSRLAVAARYVFAPTIFEFLRKTEPGINTDIQLTDAIRLMLQSGHRALGITLPKTTARYDIGSFENYFRAFQAFTPNPSHTNEVTDERV